MNQDQFHSNPNTPKNWLPLPANQVRLAQILSFILAGIWLVFGVIFLTRSQASMSLPPGWSIVIGLLMFGNAAAFIWIGYGLGTRRKLYFYFALLLVAANLILTFTDQIGLYDVLTLILLLVLLGLLLWSRKTYTGHPPA